MKDALIVFGAAAVFAIAWCALAKRLRHHGKSRVVSHICGAAVGFLASVIFLIVAIPSDHQPTTAAPLPTALTTEPARAASPTASITDVEAAKQWPELATVKFAQSSDERKFLSDQTCLDETSCYGPKRFKHFILKTYPDIAQIKFEADTESGDDRETVDMNRQYFVQSLYFAKRIRLADGQSLFDFLRTCSKVISRLNAAQENFDGSNQTGYFDLQYFPVLRSLDTGREVELQLLYDRRGDHLIARSPFFSSNALRARDFLLRHRVECWTER